MKECPACKKCFPDHVNHCPHDGDATTHSIAGEPILDGRYQLEKRLGQGGMGVVFKARHIFLKTSHAIKVILPDLVGNDPMLVTRFRQEALAAAAIRHPNIIAVTDFGVARGTMPFLVMEFVQGKSLHDILVAEKCLPPSRALEIMSAIGAGVSAAHKQNIVHRDLKPLNIMMQDDLPIAEGLKILDFGLAKIKSGDLLGSFVQAKTSGLMGSPFYMAPEQWSDEEPDARADIYSLAVIMFQVLGGDVPFKGTSIPSIMKKHLTSAPPTFAELGVQVPSQVEAVVRHGLEKEALNRPASVAAFISELRDAVASASLSLDRTQVGRMESPTVVTPPATSTTPPRPTPNTSGDLAGTISSGSLEDYAQMQSSASMEAQRLREQAALLDERARQASEAQKREQERREQERLEQERVEQERREQERREMEERDRLAREELAREEAFRLQSQAEAKKKAEEEAARQSAEKAAQVRAEQEAKQRADQEAELRAEQEAKLRAEQEAQKRAAEEAQLRAEQEAKLRAEHEEKLRLEQEARRKAEEEAKLRAQQEARQRQEQEARLQAEQEARRKAEEEAARLRAEAEAARMRAAAEEAGRKAAEENAKRLAAEQARLQAEEEAKRRLAQSERELAERQLASTSVQSYDPTPSGVDLEATQHQRGGAVTQPVGADSLPGVGQQSWQQQSQPGLHTSSAPGTFSGEQQKKSSLPMILAAAIVGFVVLVGGGVGIYFVTRSSSKPTTPPIVNNGNGANPGGPNQPNAVVKPEVIAIPGGTFQMGRADGPATGQEGPPHSVTVASFALDKIEVTNSEYADFVRETNHKPPSHWGGKSPIGGQEQMPVVNVSLEDARAFAAWRSKRDGVKYRLPTEEEWEYAARGGDQGNLYPWGNDWISGRAATKDAGLATLKPVGSYPEGKTRWGQLDMIGNVWEWTSSKSSYYPGSDLSVKPEQKSWSVIRGGSLASDPRGAKAITNAYRDWIDPTTENDLLGFRLVREGS